ncbi:hypothetical protein HED60_04440 [Planctomycetales bacterium ZRK34]|nr:hypothetical protein HED60_04440 [Planctomycetales bacterium ZRK34]
MSPQRRQLVLITTLLAMLLAVVAWSYSAMSQAKANASATAKDLAECSKLAQMIQQTRRQPQLVGDHELAFTDLSRQIEEAAEKQGIHTDAIVRISPEPARRLGRTAYREQPTRIELRQATLKQLLGLMHQLTATSPSLRIRGIRLSAPRSESDDQTWNTEFTLSHLQYSPDKNP